MATNFPSSVDNFTNPTANDSLNAPSHSLQHANANDAIEAVEDYLLNGAGKTGLIHLNTTTFSAQSSIAIDNIFTTNYAAYKILFNLTSTINGYPIFQLRKAGVPNSANYQWGYQYINSSGTSGINTSGASYSSVQLNTGSGTGAFYSFVMDILNPQISTTETHYFWSFTETQNGRFGTATGRHMTSDSYDGINLSNSVGGTFTGTIRIYGYKNT